MAQDPTDNSNFRNVRKNSCGVMNDLLCVSDESSLTPLKVSGEKNLAKRLLCVVSQVFGLLLKTIELRPHHRDAFFDAIQLDASKVNPE